MKLKAKAAFSWAHHGTVVQHYDRGDVFDTDDADLIAVARREGWAAPVRASQAESEPEPASEAAQAIAAAEPAGDSANPGAPGAPETASPDAPAAVQAGAIQA